MKKMKYALITGIVFALLFTGGLLGFTISRSILNEDDEDIRELELVVDKENIMRGETFNVSVANVPEDANITWFMGDGEILFGQRCCYSFDISMTYSILAEARWDGGHGNGTVNICSFVEDIHVEKEGNRIIDLRRGWGQGNGIYANFYYCEMGEGPEIHASMELSEAVGRIEVRIWCHAYDPDFYFSESYDYIAAYETISFDEVYSNLNIPPTSEPIEFELRFIVWDGTIGSYSLELDIDYPEP